MRSDENKSPLGLAAKLLIGVYLALLVVLLLVELGVAQFLAERGGPELRWLRASNQVLLLLAFLLLPFIILALGKAVRSLTLKVSGQELHLELTELKRDVGEEVERVEINLAGQVSNAEQALWPLLAGRDCGASGRLSGEKKEIIIGSKLDTSQVFLAALLGVAVERFVSNAHCELRVPNGGSMKNFADVRFHWIDMYVDFTGTCCRYFNIDHRGKSDDALVEELNYYGRNIGIRFLAPLGASEDYCLVMHERKARELGVTSIPDLKMVAPRLVFTADPEFLNRNDCYLAMKKYGLNFRAVTPCKIVERYALMESGEADLFVGYETDPELEFGSVVRLQDPDEFFPRYMALPVVHMEALEKVPELENALLKLANSITTRNLIEAVMELSNTGRHPAIARELAASHVPDNTGQQSGI